MLYFGIPDEDIYPINMELVMRKNLAVVGGVTRDRHRALLEANAYLRAHPQLSEELITHKFDRARVQQAFVEAGEPRTGRLKVVISLGI